MCTIEITPVKHLSILVMLLKTLETVITFEAERHTIPSYMTYTTQWLLQDSRFDVGCFRLVLLLARQKLYAYLSPHR